MIGRKRERASSTSLTYLHPILLHHTITTTEKKKEKKKKKTKKGKTRRSAHPGPGGGRDRLSVLGRVGRVG